MAETIYSETEALIRAMEAAPRPKGGQMSAIGRMREGMSHLDLYVWTVRNLGVPARAYHENGEFILEAPYTKLDSAAFDRFEANLAEHVVSMTETWA